MDQVLVPELRPGDVVVFDNLKPHLSRHVAESIERAGAIVLPLPPYSSDYDPIEELWSEVQGTASPDRGADEGRLVQGGR